MFNLIFVFIFALFGSIGLLLPVDQSTDFGTFVFGMSCFLLALSFVWLIASSANCLKSYSDQVYRFEKLHSKLNNLKRFKGKQLELITEFKFYLGEKFPELEKELHQNISKNSSDISIILNYPEIKSSELLVKLTKEIGESIKNVYDIERGIENDCADIRYYRNGKWEIVKPEIPENLKKFIYNEIEI
jgi:hypothetical protein